MKEVTLVDQVMDSLAFEVEEVPQDGQVSSASSNSPLNVRIRIRKKNKKQPLDGGIISIPKIDQPDYDSEKIRVTSSDQTITSFNVLMERGQSIKKRPPKQKRIMQLFKRGGCLGVQNDEDQCEYSMSTPQQPDKANELPEPMERISNDDLDKANFTLAKNYNNTEALQANKHNHTDFLGKCKPGGCLDPPFGEDKYPYLPKFIDVAETDETETKTKIKECECKENLPTDTKIESRDENKINESPILEREKPVDKHDSNTSIKSSNSIITFPSGFLSTEALNKLQIQKRSKSYSSSRESKSYNLSNQLLETYYISPKIKTMDQELDRDTESKDYLDPKDVDLISKKDQENLLGDTKPEAYINSDLGLNENFQKDEKIALRLTRNEVITDDIMNSVIQGDETVSLKDQENDMESLRIHLMENDEPTINVMPATNPINMDDSEILIDKQKVESDNQYLDIGDTIAEADWQGKPKKSVESIFRSENGTETIIASPNDLTVEKIDLKEINGAKEAPSNEILHGTTETITKTVESDEFRNKNVTETTSLPQDYSTNHENLKALDMSLGSPEEINQAIVRTLTKSVESIVTGNKSSIEMMIAPTQDLLYVNEDLPLKDNASKISSSIEQQNKDTTNLDTLSISKHIDDDSIKGDHSIDTKDLLQNINSISNEALITTKKDTRVSSPQENLSYIEATDSTKNGNTIETDFPPQDPLHDREALNIIEQAANANLQESDRSIILSSKISEDKFRKLVDEHDNKVEEHVENSIKTASKVGTEKNSIEELKIDKVVFTSLITSKESNIERYSNSITKLSIQNDYEEKHEIKVESFHLNKNDTINSDELAKQGYEDTSMIVSDTNLKKVSEMNIDVSSVDNITNASVTNFEKVSEMNNDVSSVDNITNNENLELTENIEMPEIEDHKESKVGILQDEIYHKDLEVTFSENVITERLESSENISSKPTYGTETPIDLEFVQPRDEIRDSKQNFIKKTTVPGDNASVSNEKHKNLREPVLSNYKEQGVIHLNMAFQSFETEQDGSVIRTLNFSSFSDSDRYPNDNILQFKTIIRPNDGEIKIPIDENKDLVLQIKTNQRYTDQRDRSMKSNFDKPISSKYENNLLKEDNEKGSLLPIINSKTKYNTLTKTILDGSTTNEINLQETLDDVYNDKLLPLHDIIKKLKNDINELTKQQTLIKERLYNAKRVQSNTVHTSGKKCGCTEMLFSRL